MRNLRKAALASFLALACGCAGVPGGKIDLVYRGLQERLPRFDPSILAGRRIAIDPGHGGLFRGTTGQDSLDEASVNLGVALYLGGLLREAGADVHYTRSADRDFLTPADSTLEGDLRRRVSIVDSIQPDIFVSIHHNAQSRRDPKTNMVETYYKFGDPSSRDLAFAIHRHLMRNLGIPNGEVRQGNYYILRSVQATAILGEASYLTHPLVENKLRLAEKQKLEAEAYFLGILDYFHRGTPMVSLIEPEESCYASVPTVVFYAQDKGGYGIDPDGVAMTLNGRPVDPILDPATGRGTYRLPWNARNGSYTVAITLRNILGNTSKRVQRRFEIALPPERALFFSMPESIPEEGGGIRVRAIVLDKRGQEIAEGTEALLTLGVEKRKPYSASVRAGMVEFLLNVPPGRQNVPMELRIAGRSFSYTIPRTVVAGRAERKLFMVDALSRGPVSGICAVLGDSLVPLEDTGGTVLIPAEWDSLPAFLVARGYKPLPLASLRADTLRLEPWFEGVLTGKRFVLNPEGGQDAPRGLLGLGASFVNLQVAAYLASYLERAGAGTLIVRGNEQTPTSHDIVAMTNRFSADRYIEIRHSCKEENGGGARSFYYPGSSRGRDLAEKIVSAFARMFALQKSEPLEEVSYPLQQTACPAAVIDAPSVEAVEEELRLGEVWYLRKQAYAIFDGILAHMGAPEGAEVEITVRADPADDWLITLDRTFRLMTDDAGNATFLRVDPGRHLLMLSRSGVHHERPIEVPAVREARFEISP